MRSILEERTDETQRPHFTALDFARDLDGLADEAVNPTPYVRAAELGTHAVPVQRAAGDRIDPYALGQAQAQLRRKYADQMQARVAANFADAMNAIGDDSDDYRDADAVYAAANAKLDALGSDVTRYAEPPWSAGWAGYGTQLGQCDVLMNWVLDDSADHCEDCPALEAGSPYSADDMPTWPKQGDTACLDRCYCTIQADESTWGAAFGAPAA